MGSLRSSLIRLAHQNPEIRPHLLPLLSKSAEDYGLEGGGNEPTDKALWEKVLGKAKAKFDVYPSATASAWAVQQYNDQGGGWKKKAVEHAVSYMSVQHLRELESHARDLAGQIDQNTMLPDWVEAKITEAAVQLRNVYEFMAHGQGSKPGDAKR